MNISTLKPNELTAKQLDVWSNVQRADPSFRSPFFRPEFTQLIASIREDVEVGLLEQDGEPFGFFPFQRGRHDVARPVGLNLSDYQGVIVGGHTRWNAEQLLQGCRLRAWHFDHLLADQKPFERHHWLLAESPYADLSQGFAFYQQQIKKRKEIKILYRKIRNLERDAGRLRLLPHAPDDDLLRTLLDWKAAQYARTGVAHSLAADWKVEVLRRVAAARGEWFSGMLSALYAGDHLVALHLGMRSGGNLHGWFPTYNTDFSRYSPGLILWLRLAEEGPAMGLHCIDFGKGDARYKQLLATGSIGLAEGSRDARWFVPAIRSGWCRARQWIRTSRWREPVQRCVRGVRKRFVYKDFA